MQKWSNGDPVTAKDFVYAWQRLLDPKTAAEYAFIAFPIKNAEAVNKERKTCNGTRSKGSRADLTLEVELEQAIAILLKLSSIPIVLSVK
ncbi:ABC transporter substrate-binding protein [Bacillus paranthracis]